MTEKHDTVIAKLAAKLESLETLREELGNETVDAKKREIEEKREVLIQTSGGSLVLGNVDTKGGDFVGRDRLAAHGGRGVVIGGDATRVILVTGDGNQVSIATAEAPLETLLAAYYRDLAAECSRLPLGVVAPRFAQPGARTEISLPSIYTDLHLVSVPREEGEEERRYGLRLARADEGERKALLDVVTGERGGRIVLVSSITGLVGQPMRAAYSAAKGAVIAYAKSLAREVASRGMTVNCIAPQVVEGGLARRMKPAVRDLLLANTPLGRVCTPAEVAAAAVYLASPGAAYVTGTVLNLTGGMVTW